MNQSWQRTSVLQLQTKPNQQIRKLLSSLLFIYHNIWSSSSTRARFFFVIKGHISDQQLPNFYFLYNLVDLKRYKLFLHHLYIYSRIGNRSPRLSMLHVSNLNHKPGLCDSLRKRAFGILYSFLKEFSLLIGFQHMKCQRLLHEMAATL
jgi:hypothetical protein